MRQTSLKMSLKKVLGAKGSDNLEGLGKLWRGSEKRKAIDNVSVAVKCDGSFVLGWKELVNEKKVDKKNLKLKDGAKQADDKHANVKEPFPTTAFFLIQERKIKDFSNVNGSHYLFPEHALSMVESGHLAVLETSDTIVPAAVVDKAGISSSSGAVGNGKSSKSSPKSGSPKKEKPKVVQKNAFTNLKWTPMSKEALYRMVVDDIGIDAYTSYQRLRRAGHRVTRDATMQRGQLCSADIEASGGREKVEEWLKKLWAQEDLADRSQSPAAKRQKTGGESPGKASPKRSASPSKSLKESSPSLNSPRRGSPARTAEAAMAFSIQNSKMYEGDWLLFENERSFGEVVSSQSPAESLSTPVSSADEDSAKKNANSKKKIQQNVQIVQRKLKFSSGDDLFRLDDHRYLIVSQDGEQSYMQMEDFP